ncbi:hypothetical protein [Arcticibacter tournemirensis]
MALELRPAITTLLLIWALSGSSQSVSTVKQEVEKSISDFFMGDKGIFERVPDSGKVYRFFFQVDVSRTSTRRLSVTSIKASDTIAHKLYPDSHFLKTLQWNVYMHKRKKASFIIPIVLDVISSKGETHKNERSDQLKAFRSLFKNDGNVEDYIYFRPVIFVISKQIFD